MTEPDVEPLHLGFGEFELSEKTFELRQRGEVVSVQPKVLDLLIYLARHRDRVVTKEELLEQVWAEAAVSEASLSQAVSAARRALGDSSSEPQILATVRGRGFRFVAPAKAADPMNTTAQDGRLPLAPAKSPISVIDSAIPSTAVESSQAHGGAAPEQFLYLIMRAVAPGEGGAAICLTDVDELTIERGESRYLRRYEADGKRCARLTLVGEAVSRKHARLVRSDGQFSVRDLGSSNGTWVMGKRVDVAPLTVNTVFECGHTLFELSSSRLERGIAPDLLTGFPKDQLFPSIMPSLRALDRDLEKIAASDSPLWLEGEHGVGKSRLALAVHAASGASGELARLDCVHASAAETDWSKLLEQARGGSMLLENIDALDQQTALSLAAHLDSAVAKDVRLLATSRMPYADLLNEGASPELLGRFSGYRAEIPPLRRRIADLGGLIANLDDPSDPISLDAVTALALCRHRWPGNITELRACLQVARQMAGGSKVRTEHLPPAVRGLS